MEFLSLISLEFILYNIMGEFILYNIMGDFIQNCIFNLNLEQILHNTMGDFVRKWYFLFELEWLILPGHYECKLLVTKLPRGSEALSPFRGTRQRG